MVTPSQILTLSILESTPKARLPGFVAELEEKINLAMHPMLSETFRFSLKEWRTFELLLIETVKRKESLAYLWMRVENLLSAHLPLCFSNKEEDTLGFLMAALNFLRRTSEYEVSIGHSTTAAAVIRLVAIHVIVVEKRRWQDQGFSARAQLTEKSNFSSPREAMKSDFSSPYSSSHVPSITDIT